MGFFLMFLTYPYLPPTVDQFKAQFFRDFPYAVPSFGATATATVVAGVVTGLALNTGGQYYKSAPTVYITPAPLPQGVPGPGSGATATATVNASGQVASVVLGAGGTGYTNGVIVTFVGGSGNSADKNQVQDLDIANAIAMCASNVNPLFSTSVPDFIQTYNLLAAHYLVENIRASTQGLASQGNPGWNTSKGAGEFSESFDVPDFIKENASLAIFGRTKYGVMYISKIQPYMVGGGLGLLQAYPAPGLTQQYFFGPLAQP